MHEDSSSASNGTQGTPGGRISDEARVNVYVTLGAGEAAVPFGTLFSDISPRQRLATASTLASAKSWELAPDSAKAAIAAAGVGEPLTVAGLPAAAATELGAAVVALGAATNALAGVYNMATGDSGGGKGAEWAPPEGAAAKVPSEWGAGTPTNKGVGARWQDPANPGNGIRIDQGNPANSQVTQQVDHVIVRSNGQVIGRSGAPIPGSIAENGVEAHIPLSEWINWSSWNHP